MLTPRRYITAVVLLFFALDLNAQNLTGTWEGDLGTEQFLQLNIIQTGNKICGYTYDRVKADRNSFCKAFFEGYFDAAKQRLVINGRYFLMNSGEHVLMRLRLNLRTNRTGDRLIQEPTPITYYRERSSIFGIQIEPYIVYDSTEYVNIRRVSDKPYEFNELMNDCIARDKVTGQTTPKTIPPKPKDTVVFINRNPPPKRKDTVKVKPAPPLVKKDSVITRPPVVIKKDSVALPKTVAQRKNKEQSRITVNTKSINLKVYDNAVMDGDTVSILYNGRYLLTRKLLTEKGIEINLELEDNQTRHEIVLFAHNLGSIPPNTALIVITTGDQRYELFASASLEENAVLIFDYKPK